MENACGRDIGNCSSGSHCLVSRTAFDGTYATYVESGSMSYGTVAGTSVSLAIPDVEAASQTLSTADPSPTVSLLAADVSVAIPTSSGIYACTTAGMAEYGTMPDFAYVLGSGETISRFCQCETPSYTSMAPPFCWSSTQAALCGSYRCGKCETVHRIPVYGGSHCAYADPEFTKSTQDTT